MEGGGGRPYGFVWFSRDLERKNITKPVLVPNTLQYGQDTLLRSQPHPVCSVASRTETPFGSALGQWRKGDFALQGGSG